MLCSVMRNPLVTVVIPAFNGERYIVAAIESVLAQTWPALECIVVDDGSTDSTSAEVSRFGERVRLIRQTNCGVTRARNRGVALARGEFVAFLDQDDLWFPDKLERQMAALERSGATMVLCGVELIGSDGQQIGRLRLRAISDLLEGLLTFDGTEAVSCGSTGLLSREGFMQIGRFDETLGSSADLDLLLRVLLHGRLAYVEEDLVRYRVHGENTSRDIAAIERDMSVVLAKAFADPEMPASLRARRDHAYARMYRMVSGSYRDYGKHRDAVRTALLALRYEPSLAIQEMRRRRTSGRHV
jgi:glycosyltransferase involved in cell wall biosynthesis